MTALGGVMLAAGLFLLGGIVRLLGGVLRGMLADEARGRLGDFSTVLVERAVLRLPARHREEKRREWLAELHEQLDTPLSAFWWSWRLYRSRSSTAQELRDGRETIAWLPPDATPAEALRREEFPPFLRACIERARGPGWEDVKSVMQDPTLGQVEGSLAAATDRFCTMIERSRGGPSRVMARWAAELNVGADRGSIYDPPIPQLRPGFEVWEHSRGGRAVNGSPLERRAEAAAKGVLALLPPPAVAVLWLLILGVGAMLALVGGWIALLLRA
jgi:hypothetical protein